MAVMSCSKVFTMRNTSRWRSLDTKTTKPDGLSSSSALKRESLFFQQKRISLDNPWPMTSYQFVTCTALCSSQPCMLRSTFFIVMFCCFFSLGCHFQCLHAMRNIAHCCPPSYYCCRRRCWCCCCCFFPYSVAPHWIWLYTWINEWMTDVCVSSLDTPVFVTSHTKRIFFVNARDVHHIFHVSLYVCVCESVCVQLELTHCIH